MENQPEDTFILDEECVRGYIKTFGLDFSSGISKEKKKGKRNLMFCFFLIKKVITETMRKQIKKYLVFENILTDVQRQV